MHGERRARTTRTCDAGATDTAHGARIAQCARRADASFRVIAREIIASIVKVLLIGDEGNTRVKYLFN